MEVAAVRARRARPRPRPIGASGLPTARCHESRGLYHMNIGALAAYMPRIEHVFNCRKASWLDPACCAASCQGRREAATAPTAVPVDAVLLHGSDARPD